MHDKKAADAFRIRCNFSLTKFFCDGFHMLGNF